MNDALTSIQEAPTSVPAALPQAWFGSAEEKTFQAKLAAASKHTLLLDYDGTLAPFRADKMQALPYPGVTEILQELNQLPHLRLVLVTGRRAAELLQLIEVARNVDIWGSHGREHIDRSGKYTFYPPTTEQSATLATLQREIETSLRDLPLSLDVEDLPIPSHGLQPRVEAPELLESKPASIATHWRGLTATSQVLMRDRVEAAYRLHGNALIERLPFECGVEFRAVGYTKAYPVIRELEESGEGSLIAYLGDDLTDEDAFNALNGRGETLLVRSEVRPSHAKHWLRPPEELLQYLRSWIT